MKCFVTILAAIVGMASAAPQYYLADTPEVQAAKQQFAAAYNAAVARTGPVAPYEAVRSSAVPAGIADPGNVWPEAEPYIHEEIPAEPYIHLEGESTPVAAPVQPAAPVAPIAPAPAFAPAAPAYNFNLGYPGYYLADTPEVQAAKQQFAAAYNAALPAVAAPAAPAGAPWHGGCYNWLGEGVQCRTQF